MQQPGPAAAICDLCGREIVASRAEHYRRHLENARAYLELVEKRGGDPSWSTTARDWIERCETMLAEPRIRDGELKQVAVTPEGEICRPDADA